MECIWQYLAIAGALYSTAHICVTAPWTAIKHCCVQQNKGLADNWIEGGGNFKTEVFT